MNNRQKAMTAYLALFIAATIMSNCGNEEEVNRKIIRPAYGTIRNFIETNGIVEPRNRLEIKPPINGRVDRIIIREGDPVRKGQPLLYMSSTERAALIDAARAQGSSSLSYWKNVYKEIPVVAPISGKVIVRDIEPGQTVTSASVMLVLSDKLLVTANVDETDIGHVKLGQKATIELDAYEDISVQGTVDQISFESKIVSNVTTYEVKIIPDTIPSVFRSGMSATIKIIREENENALLIPVIALKNMGGRNYVLVMKHGSDSTEKRFVKTGITDDVNIEVTEGLSEKDSIVIESKKIEIRENTGSNPFLPFGGKKGKKK
jgi:macrolide-specific efflux system membrane fusion protein